MVAPGGVTQTHAKAGAEVPNMPAATAVAIANADQEPLVIAISSSVFLGSEQVFSAYRNRGDDHPRGLVIVWQ
jgi:hypothetical protein